MFNHRYNWKELQVIFLTENQPDAGCGQTPAHSLQQTKKNLNMRILKEMDSENALQNRDDLGSLTEVLKILDINYQNYNPAL